MVEKALCDLSAQRARGEGIQDSREQPGLVWEAPRLLLDWPSPPVLMESFLGSGLGAWGSLSYHHPGEWGAGVTRVGHPPAAQKQTFLPGAKGVPEIKVKSRRIARELAAQVWKQVPERRLLRVPRLAVQAHRNSSGPWNNTPTIFVVHKYLT